MNFRRQPFQFTAIDPAKRQAELQKRFGLPTNNSDMYVDFLNPNMMGSGIKEPSLSSGSPRLQHRLPVFSENAEKVNAEQNNVDGGHKPRVRVVPIQLEGVDGGRRHRTHSGPAGLLDGCNDKPNGKLQETFPHFNSTKDGEKFEQSCPRVCNIPVQIEPREKQIKVEKVKVEQNPKTSEPVKKLKSETNGCAASLEKKEDSKSLSLKQIEKVLNKLNEYKEEVEKFSGISKDKQYRYLDEMLTRCMLDLDNVDTMGLDHIRKARKEAVRQVQHYVDLLDTKVNMDSELTTGVNFAEEFKESEMSSDIPANSNITTITDENELVQSISESASRVVETNGANCNDVSENKTVNGNITGDVEMTEERTLDNTIEDSTNESLDNMSCQDVPIDNARLQQEEVIESSVPEVEMEESAMCNGDKFEMKDCSKIIIEELDNSLECDTNNSTSNVIETEDNVQCIVSHSPELSVKETIAEEVDSEVLIEEVECDDNILDNIDHSSNSCDQVDNDKKLTEQLNIKDYPCSESVVQESIDSKKL